VTARRSHEGRPDARQLSVKAAMVPLWSSGYIAGTLATRHAAALAVTFWRFLAATMLMGAIALARGSRWPRGRPLVAVIVVGALLQALQFDGLFLGLQHGVPAGLAALLAGSSPLAVALAAAGLFGERLRTRQWAGSAIGVAGVALAVAADLGGKTTVLGLCFALVGFAGLVGGTVVQRHFGGDTDPRAANAIQLAVAVVLTAPLTAAVQGFGISTGVATLGPLAWLVAINSVSAVLLYFWLLRREKGGEATSFLYLVPSATAVIAVPVLGQPLKPGVIAGLALALIGTTMVSASRPERAAAGARQVLRHLHLGPAR
jgi:drug/metabolite transporter (DMT)-like permease